MSLAQTLFQFQGDVAQCDSLISTAHRLDGNGMYLLVEIDRRQITVAAFLNMFIAWESFVEGTLSKVLAGRATTNGSGPKKYVRAPSVSAALDIIIGTQRYFDYANHENLKKIVNMYLINGYPFEPHLSAIYDDLSSLRTMRNASAHISSTTQTKLETLALKLFGSPRPGIALYQLLMAPDPQSPAGATIFAGYRDKLLVTAGLISQG
jgi:hypothetical protein